MLPVFEFRFFGILKIQSVLVPCYTLALQPELGLPSCVLDSGLATSLLIAKLLLCGYPLLCVSGHVCNKTWILNDVRRLSHVFVLCLCALLRKRFYHCSRVQSPFGIEDLITESAVV
eukprot:905454-Amphidinium_carterae.1